MEANRCSLLVEPSYPDLVINVGEVTLGEENRKKLQKIQRDQEKERVLRAACALLNSGGGVIRMAKKDEHPVEMGLDLEKSLRDLIQSSDLQAFFETKQQGRCFYIFVKSWSSDPFPEDGSVKPRLCSLTSSLYCRSETSVLPMDSREAFCFLKIKKKNAKILEEGPCHKVQKVIHQEFPNTDPADRVFQKDYLEYGEILPFPESQLVEFKQFSTKHIQEYVKSIIPEYIPAFANTRGGYLFIGVDDKSRKVLGCAKENVDPDSLRWKIETAICKLPCVHFCQLQCHITFTLKIVDVLARGELYGYACMIRVKPFCCAVFSEAPKSWIVKDKQVCSLTTEKWVGMMTDTDPDLVQLSKDFESQLSLSGGPPLSRPVYSKKGLEHKKELQQRLFSVPLGHLQYTPESLWKDLTSQHEGLEELINEQMQPFFPGILIFSRSWAVDLNLQEKPGVICDALLIAQNSTPILYTILRQQDTEGQDYCTHTAFTLKQNLVNMGGYTGKVCVRAKVLYLSPESSTEALEAAVSPMHYPPSYRLAGTQHMEALLQSLVIVLLGFRSLLSDQLGCEVLNLLTAQQYEIFSKNLRKNRELFVHGLPGSGKTIMAMKIMEKIRNVFHCEEQRILYVCENQPLRNFISNRKICKAVTRKTFLKNNFEHIQHIIIDEAQNFRTEDGDWYGKAKTITRRVENGPGILWIFLDYFQTSHLDHSGLPLLSEQYPREELTRIVRNADPIAKYLQKEMQVIRKNPSLNIPPGSLEVLLKAEWSQGVQGNLKIKERFTVEQIVTYVANKCKRFFERGYSPKDVAVLVSTAKEVECYKYELLKALRKKRAVQLSDACNILSDHIMLDSVRRFSGLERNIVFGIYPRTAESSIIHNILVCLASRAKQHLYIFLCGDC
ncbi:schlafen family member 11 [Sapajus apella]|uniref:Schlafen family member 11 n=1 Tax=Sapajus apella TaxID=9515 RepID=A0A6J3I381_SAPAP|nr:schlafen family member 11 [Sapajus apella]XP_032136762.1 schlafen family member 11 [Sapajus apella]XP_032136763.1 schlafen family member 11 [Sapajus apella]